VKIWLLKISKENLILALFVSNIAFWLYTASKKKKADAHVCEQVISECPVTGNGW
jgi:hypothetical protein